MLFGDHVLKKNVLEGYFRCLRYNSIICMLLWSEYNYRHALNYEK